MANTPDQRVFRGPADVPPVKRFSDPKTTPLRNPGVGADGPTDFHRAIAVAFTQSVFPRRHVHAAGCAGEMCPLFRGAGGNSTLLLSVAGAARTQGVSRWEWLVKTSCGWALTRCLQWKRGGLRGHPRVRTTLVNRRSGSAI